LNEAITKYSKQILCKNKNYILIFFVIIDGKIFNIFKIALKEYNAIFYIKNAKESKNIGIICRKFAGYKITIQN
jgi:hypothetical protein